MGSKLRSLQQLISMMFQQVSVRSFVSSKAQIQTGQLLSFDDVFDVLSLCRSGPPMGRGSISGSFLIFPGELWVQNQGKSRDMIWMMLNRMVLLMHLVSFEVVDKRKPWVSDSTFAWIFMHSATDLHIPIFQDGPRCHHVFHVRS